MLFSFDPASIVTVFSFGLLLNANRSITSSDAGNASSSNNAYPQMPYFPIVFNFDPLSKMIDVHEFAPCIEFSAIVVTDAGMCRDLNLGHHMDFVAITSVPDAMG